MALWLQVNIIDPRAQNPQVLTSGNRIITEAISRSTIALHINLLRAFYTDQFVSVSFVERYIDIWSTQKRLADKLVRNLNQY